MKKRYIAWLMIILGIISILSAFYNEHLNVDFVILAILGVFIILHGLGHITKK